MQASSKGEEFKISKALQRHLGHALDARTGCCCTTCNGRGGAPDRRQSTENATYNAANLLIVCLLCNIMRGCMTLLPFLSSAMPRPDMQHPGACVALGCDV